MLGVKVTEAPAHVRRARRFAERDIVLDLGALALADQRPHCHAGVCGIANLDMRGHRRGHRGKGRADAVVHQQTRGDRAALPGIDRKNTHRHGGGALHIGVVPHDHRRFSAEFQASPQGLFARQRFYGHK